MRLGVHGSCLRQTHFLEILPCLHQSQLGRLRGDATLLIILDDLLLHRRGRDLGDLLGCRNDKFGGAFVADQIVQHRRGRLRDDGFIVVVEQTCPARIGGRLFEMEMEGRRGWSFRGDGDLETMDGGRGSLWTRDHGMWSGGDINLGSRSLWWRVETSELDIPISVKEKYQIGIIWEDRGWGKGGVQVSLNQA